MKKFKLIKIVEPVEYIEVELKDNIFVDDKVCLPEHDGLFLIVEEMDFCNNKE